MMVDAACQIDISGTDLDGMEDSNTANIMCNKAHSQCLNDIVCYSIQRMCCTQCAVFSPVLPLKESLQTTTN